MTAPADPGWPPDEITVNGVRFAMRVVPVARTDLHVQLDLRDAQERVGELTMSQAPGNLMVGQVEVFRGAAPDWAEHYRAVRHALWAEAARFADAKSAVLWSTVPMVGAVRDHYGFENAGAIWRREPLSVASAAAQPEER